MEFIITSTEAGTNPKDILDKYPCLKSDFNVDGYPDIQLGWLFLRIEIKDLEELYTLAKKLEADIIFNSRHIWGGDIPSLEIYDDWRE